ncbi:MAG TPA: ATP-binding protein, partial [Gammaproteobacteria bacterium]
IQTTFESDEYRIRLQEINDEYKEREEKTFNDLAEAADKKGIALIRTPGGYTLGPIKNGQILTPDEFEKLSEKEQEEVKKTTEEIEEELKKIILKIPAWQKENREKIKELTREVSRITVDQFIKGLLEQYKDLSDIANHIKLVRDDIIENINEFRKHGEDRRSAGTNQDIIASVFGRYQVNVLIDNSNTKGAPVIYEDNPTYQNLIGRIEHLAQFGTLLTDFSLIKAGALHKANGGYLILDARKVLLSPFAWEGIKRALHARELRIESLEQLLSLVSTISLQPEPIPIDIKVVLTGERILYYLLKEYDPEFGLLFKVAADFSEDIDRSQENTLLYAKMIASLQRNNQLKDITKDGVARIIEHCSRMTDDAEKISLHMGNLIDLLQEADYWANDAQDNNISAMHVQKAIDTRRERLDQIREKMHEHILRGSYLLDTSGEKIAQVNGLSVIQLGDYAFGKPSRITATARLGSGKVIDIEREVKLGGSIHSKGVLILSSYLANRYAQEQPMSLSASIVFEQSYGMIEGDSASAAELCALLSAIGKLPIKQCFAVTGSINQLGEIQAIGGVNEKIEGFFDICKSRGLNGEQSVIIPQSNIKNLMLRNDIHEAVETDQFQVYAVSTIDELMGLLTGMEAGEADAKGQYPDNTFNGQIQQRLQQLTELRQKFGNSDAKLNEQKS